MKLHPFILIPKPLATTNSTRNYKNVHSIKVNHKIFQKSVIILNSYRMEQIRYHLRIRYLYNKF